MEMGIYFLLRRSEYLPCRTSGGTLSRGLKWSDIKFLDAEGHVIGFNQVSIGAADSVSVLVQRSKTDQLGEGRVRTHKRQHHGHCIVAVIVAWALEMRAHGADFNSHVFEREGFPIITDVSIAEAMKAIVSSQGLDHHKISTHSLRYGGTTLLAAAGIPAYAITYFGGWSENSSMLRRYAQLGGQMTNEVSRVMSEAFGKSLVEARIRGNTLSGR
jgi:integrase